MSNGEPVNGALDEVAIYNTALTPSRIQAHYDSAVSAPVNTTPPAVTGFLENGAVLTATTGAWGGAPSTYAYQWQTCTDAGACSDLSGATASSYTLVDDDINANIRASVVASNSFGSGAAVSTAVGHVRIPHYSQSSDGCDAIEDAANLLIDYPKVIYTFIPVSGPPFYEYDYTGGTTGGKAAAAVAQENWNGGLGSNSSWYDYGSNGSCVNQDTFATNSFASGHHVRFWISAVGRRPVGAAHHDFVCGFGGHSSDQWIESADDLGGFFYNYEDFNNYQPHPVWAAYQDRPFTVRDKCGEEVPDDGITQELDFRGTDPMHITGNGGGGLP
jgi:hypothetical protein